MTPLALKALPIAHMALGLILAIMTLGFLMRIILTWYPKININKGLWPILTRPTEPFLKITRQFIAPIGGVDVSPVIWVGLTSLARELLVGQQGIISQILLNSEMLG